jgi:hypothetical protein
MSRKLSGSAPWIASCGADVKKMGDDTLDADVRSNRYSERMGGVKTLYRNSSVGRTNGAAARQPRAAHWVWSGQGMRERVA